MSQLDQQDLLNFHHVASTGSITRAAESLKVSKGYISKSVTRLEHALNVKLLQRSTRQLLLTDAGESLFATTQSMQSKLSDGLEALQSLSNEPRGKLRISAPPALAEYVLAPLLTKFQTIYPEVTIEIILEAKIVDVISAGYDLVFRSMILKDSNLIARHLMDAESVLVANPKLFNQYDQPKDPEDLAKLPCVSYHEKSNITWKFQKERQKRNIDIQPIMTCNSLSFLKQCVCNGLGITRLPLFMVEADLKQKQLRQVLKRWQQPKSPIYLIYPSRDYIPMKTKCFIEFITKELSQL